MYYFWFFDFPNYGLNHLETSNKKHLHKSPPPKKSGGLYSLPTKKNTRLKNNKKRWAFFATNFCLCLVTFSSSEPFPNIGPVAPSSGTPREGPPGCPGCPPGGAGAKGLDPTGAATPGLALFLGWHHRCPTKKRLKDSLKLPSQNLPKIWRLAISYASLLASVWCEGKYGILHSPTEQGRGFKMFLAYSFGSSCQSHRNFQHLPSCSPSKYNSKRYRY